MARPKSDNPKSQKFTIRLTADELALVEAMAEAAGCDRSTYARECLLKGSVTPRQPLPEINAKTYSQLGRIGGLLNQYSVSRPNEVQVEDKPPASFTHESILD
jgi:hypothetical protein